ncbi:M1 family aminopeptidase [Chitinophagaceae bacterium MMS25-I14]
MRTRNFTFFLLLLITAVYAKAQNSVNASCALRKSSRPLALAKTTMAAPEEAYYDVKHLFFKMNMTDTTTYIQQGDVTTTAVVTAATMGKYIFELDSVLVIDSFKFNGQLKTVTTDSFVRSVTLASALTQGSTFTAEVFYHGQPASAGSFFSGIIYDTSGFGTHMVYTMSDPYNSKNWWPAKQSMGDKIDSVDMWITVPQGLKAGSNGLLQSVTTPQTGYQQYRWKTKYPIIYHLISMSIAPYIDYTYQVHFTGSNDSMPVQNFLFDTSYTMSQHVKANIDSCGQFINYFSSLFGRYPFWKEKYGHCYSTLGGGEEHQTMTTIGVLDNGIIAHELGHQWFGDCVSYGRRGHVWLSEGFASYCEELYAEHFENAAAAQNSRAGRISYIISQPGGSVYVTDTTSSATLFDGRLVYDKGDMVLHMLRYRAPQDSLFFRVLKNYQQQYAYGLAVTEDFQHIAEQVYGSGLDTFFNQWIYGQGYPIYNVKWMATGNNGIHIRLTQTTSIPSSVSMFYTPLEIKIHSRITSQDTVIKIYNDQQVQDVYFTWSQPIDTSSSIFNNPITLDPYKNVILKAYGAVQDKTLAVETPIVNTWRVYPNPATDAWRLENITPGSEATLTDINGKRIWSSTAGNSYMMIPAAGLAPGNYLLQIQAADGKTGILKLSH